MLIFYEKKIDKYSILPRILCIEIPIGNSTVKVSIFFIDKLFHKYFSFIKRHLCRFWLMKMFWRMHYMLLGLQHYQVISLSDGRPINYCIIVFSYFCTCSSRRFLKIQYLANFVIDFLEIIRAFLTVLTLIKHCRIFKKSTSDI